MLFEAVLAGSLVAPSWAGGMIGFAALAAFLARRALIVGWFARAYRAEPVLRMRARAIFVLLAGFAMMLMVGAVGLARQPVMLGVVALAAVGMGSVQFVLELRRQGRHLKAELLGACSVTLTAAMVIAAGVDGRAVAVVMACLLMLKQAMAIEYIRYRLRRSRGLPARSHLPGGMFLAVAAGVCLSVSGFLGPLGWLAIAAVTGRAAWMHRVACRPVQTARLGMAEFALGVGYALCIAGDAVMGWPGLS